MQLYTIYLILPESWFDDEDCEDVSSMIDIPEGSTWQDYCRLVNTIYDLHGYVNTTMPS